VRCDELVVDGKAPSDISALKPYWGKPAVRDFRGSGGNVGIIRSPVRATALPGNIKKGLPPRKFAPLRSRFSGYLRYADPEPLRGKANGAGEVTGKCNLQTVVVRAQASSEGRAEITSGSRSEKLGRGGTVSEISEPSYCHPAGANPV